MGQAQRHIIQIQEPDRKEHRHADVILAARQPDLAAHRKPARLLRHLAQRIVQSACDRAIAARRIFLDQPFPARSHDRLLHHPVHRFQNLTTDVHRLSQILINLLTNAAKFTSEGSITLGVEICPEQNEVLFSVTDTGPGIPLDKQEMVFNRFEKLDGNKKKGTGLGLAICRQIAMIFGSIRPIRAAPALSSPILSDSGSQRIGSTVRGGDLSLREASKPSV